MTRRPNAKLPPQDADTPSLTEILSETGSVECDTYSDVDPNTLVRLVGAVTGSGFMVTCWHDTVNSRFCLSVRGGNDKRSYNFDTAEQFQMTAEHLIGIFAPIARKRGNKPLVPIVSDNGAKPPGDPPVKP